MAVVGTGIDIIEVARIGRAAERHGTRFLRRLFTAAETDYCCSQGAPSQHLAGRFAAKEAVLKALGTGWAGGIRWRDIEVTNGPSGAPNVRLHGSAARRAEELGIDEIFISIAHTAQHAVAHAVAQTRTS